MALKLYSARIAVKSIVNSWIGAPASGTAAQNPGLAASPSSATIGFPMNATIVLWVYIILLVAGGAAGYFKAKSRVSLYTSVGSAAVLALCALNVLPILVADILMGLLILVFIARLARTRKFMPAGLMLVLTVLALAARYFLAAPGA